MRVLLVSVSSGHRGLVVNNQCIATTAPDENREFLKGVAEKLAEATKTRLITAEIVPTDDEWEWPSLLRPLEVPLCRDCGEEVVDGRCSDSDCVYHRWPQTIPREDLNTLSVFQLRRKYGVVRAKVQMVDEDDVCFEFDAADFALSAEDGLLLRILADADLCAPYIPLPAEAVAVLLHQYGSRAPFATLSAAELLITVHTDGLLWLLCKERYGVWARHICAAHGYALPERRSDRHAHANLPLKALSPDEEACDWVTSHNLSPLVRRDMPLFLSCRFAPPLATVERRLVGLRMFGPEQGYAASEIEDLRALAVGATWTSPELGSAHTVTRLS